jgi:hypothetical protein
MTSGGNRNPAKPDLDADTGAGQRCISPACPLAMIDRCNSAPLGHRIPTGNTAIRGLTSTGGSEPCQAVRVHADRTLETFDGSSAITRRAAGRPRATTKRSTLSEDEFRKLLTPESRQGQGYVWELCRLRGSDEAVLTDVSRLLSERIVEYLCPEHVYRLWREARGGQRHLTSQERQLLIVYLEPHLGNPDEAPPDHDERAQGSVSEFLWHELVRHRTEVGRKIARIEGPGFAVTDPGGDGLVVYETSAGSLVFRLWEIKKHTAKGDVAVTVGNAHKQLDRRALSYLARYSSVAQQLTHRPELHLFYATLVDKWQANDDSVGAGVAVATSCKDEEQTDCFTGLPSRFPHLTDGDRLEGLLTAIGDFARFVELVKGEVWSAL